MVDGGDDDDDGDDDIIMEDDEKIMERTTLLKQCEMIQLIAVLTLEYEILI